MEIGTGDRSGLAGRVAGPQWVRVRAEGQESSAKANPEDHRSLHFILEVLAAREGF